MQVCAVQTACSTRYDDALRRAPVPKGPEEYHSLVEHFYAHILEKARETAQCRQTVKSPQGKETPPANQGAYTDVSDRHLQEALTQ